MDKAETPKKPSNLEHAIQASSSNALGLAKSEKTEVLNTYNILRCTHLPETIHSIMVCFVFLY